MFYRILTSDESIRENEKFVKKDENTGTTLVLRETLPESDDALVNNVIFASDGTLYRYNISGEPVIIGKTKKIGPFAFSRAMPSYFGYRQTMRVASAEDSRDRTHRKRRIRRNSVRVRFVSIYR